MFGGFVGLILGALRLPALLRFIGTDAFRAVGTNAAVGFCLGVAGLLGHLTGGVDWTLLAVGAASSVPGSILGARLTGRLDERQLLRAVGFVLLVAGAALIAAGHSLVERHDVAFAADELEVLTCQVALARRRAGAPPRGIPA